jgi:phosphotransferase system HPr-like phosphotransfer protein
MTIPYTNKVIRLEKIDEIVAFVNKAMTVSEGEVYVKRDRYVVNGTSLMGLISIDVTKGITVEYPASAKEFDAFLNEFEVE